jgi:hypothetical protein
VRPLSVLLWSLSVICLASASEGNQAAAPAASKPAAMEELLPLSRSQAAQILAQSDTIAAKLDEQMRSPQRPRTPEETGEALVLAGLSDVAVHPSQWRWYARDGGILAAVPLKERLGLTESVTTEQVLADIIARVIDQIGLGYPDVQVVLIEPEYPRPATGCAVACATVPVVACGCP